MSGQLRDLWGAWVSLLLAGAVLWSLVHASQAAASPPEVTEFALGGQVYYASPITFGPEGSLWLGAARVTVTWERTESEALIDSVSPSGQVSEHPVPGSVPVDLAIGGDGNVWFVAPDRVGYLTPTGQVTSYPLPGTATTSRRIAAGSDGGIWLTTGLGRSGAQAIDRVTADGQITEFPLPHPGAGAGDITLGPDGALWFTELQAERIGRITSSGAITEFPTPGLALGITAGPDGNIWFTYGYRYSSEGGVGRMSVSGQTTLFPTYPHPAGPIAAGADGRLWFAQGNPMHEGEAAVERITPEGTLLPAIDLHASRSIPTGLAPGPDGAVWFSGWEPNICEGGGLTCHIYVPSHTAVVGRIVPGALELAIVNTRTPARQRWTGIGLSCGEGDVDSSCTGAIKLVATLSSRRGGRTAQRRVLVAARPRYRLRTGTTHRFALRLTRRGRQLFSHRRELPVTAVATMAHGETARRSVLAVRVQPHRR